MILRFIYPTDQICGICGKAYSQSCELKRHIAVWHKDGTSTKMFKYQQRELAQNMLNETYFHENFEEENSSDMFAKEYLNEIEVEVEIEERNENETSVENLHENFEDENSNENFADEYVNHVEVNLHENMHENFEDENFNENLANEYVNHIEVKEEPTE